VKELRHWLVRLKTLTADDAAMYDIPLIAAGTNLPPDSEGFIGVNPRFLLPAQIGDSHPKYLALIRFMDSREGQKNVLRLRALATELGAALTFVTGRRMETRHTISAKQEGASEVAFMGYDGIFDSRIQGPFESSLTTPLTVFLSKLASLSDEHIATLGAALNLHYAATLLFDRDLSAAYVLLVSGIEMLSRAYGLPPGRWEEWDQSQDWDAWMDEIGIVDTQREALIPRLLKDKQLRLAETFSTYASTRLRPSFWDIDLDGWIYGINLSGGTHAAPHKASSRKISECIDNDPVLLKKALKKSYEARSGFVHSGNPVAFLASLLFSGNKVQPDAPLPFAILRSILVELIETKLEETALPSNLPDVKIVFSKPSAEA
jgi:hypothetical protein